MFYSFSAKGVVGEGMAVFPPLLSRHLSAFSPLYAGSGAGTVMEVRGQRAAFFPRGGTK
jgi:hypothetical protein